MTRVTFDSMVQAAEWARDGRSLYFMSSHASRQRTLFRIPVDGSRAAESVLAAPDRPFELQVGPHDTLVLRLGGLATNRDLWLTTPDSPGVLRPLLRTPFSERSVSLSRDGRWLAYVSNEGRTDEVYVRNVAAGSGRTRVTTRGGFEPRWGAPGELLYRRVDSIFVVSARLGTSPAFGPERLVVVVPRTRASPVEMTWDVSRDGQQFVMPTLAATEQAAGPNLHLLLHAIPARGGRSGEH
jgi:hypothetical protein